MNLTHKPYPARILVADDEANTRLALVRGLQLSGYQAEGAVNGREVLTKLEQGTFDLLVLDLQMPEVNGVQVMEYIRQRQLDLLVIVLTANATLENAIAAVKAGAVDYLLKPQRMAEVESAIWQALQRSPKWQRNQLIETLQQTLAVLKADEHDPPSSPTARAPQVDLPPMSWFDPERRQVILERANGRQVVTLTADQAAILACLAAHPGKALSSREIACMALGCEEISEREAKHIVRLHILRLRRKIEADPDHPSLIQTVRGAGYLFTPPI